MESPLGCAITLAWSAVAATPFDYRAAASFVRTNPPARGDGRRQQQWADLGVEFAQRAVVADQRALYLGEPLREVVMSGELSAHPHEGTDDVDAHHFLFAPVRSGAERAWLYRVRG
jgi:hypothetical protein